MSDKTLREQLPPLPERECGAHTGHVATYTDEQMRKYACSALAAALAPAAEAVAWIRQYLSGGVMHKELEWNDSEEGDRNGDWLPLYTTPQPAPVVDAAMDKVEDTFADDVLDVLFKQEGNNGATYKAAVAFMLDRRQLRAALAPKPASDEAGSA